MTDFVGRATRGIFRDLMTDSPGRGDRDCVPRRGIRAEPGLHPRGHQHSAAHDAVLDAVDRTDSRHVTRFLRVAERRLEAFETQYLRRFHQSLHRDGYDVDDQTGQIAAIGPQLSIDSLAKLSDPAAIRESFDRIRRAISHDPALAVGNAKELLESTAKIVLTERGLPSVWTRRPVPGRTAVTA